MNVIRYLTGWRQINEERYDKLVREMKKSGNVRVTPHLLLASDSISYQIKARNLDGARQKVKIDVFGRRYRTSGRRLDYLIRSETGVISKEELSRVA